MVVLAIAYGSFLGSLQDPLFLLMLAAAGALGFFRTDILFAGGFALVSALVRIYISNHNRAAFGLDPLPPDIQFIFFGTCFFVLMLTWWIVWLIRRPPQLGPN